MRIVLAGLLLALVFLGLWLVLKVYVLPLSDFIRLLRILVKVLYIDHFSWRHVAYTLRLYEHPYFIWLLDKIRRLAGCQRIAFVRAIYLWAAVVLAQRCYVVLDYDEFLRYAITALNYHFLATLVTIIAHIRGVLFRARLYNCDINFAFFWLPLLFNNLLRSSRLDLWAYVFDYTL